MREALFRPTCRPVARLVSTPASTLSKWFRFQRWVPTSLYPALNGVLFVHGGKRLARSEQDRQRGRVNGSDFGNAPTSVMTEDPRRTPGPPSRLDDAVDLSIAADSYCPFLRNGSLLEALEEPVFDPETAERYDERLDWLEIPPILAGRLRAIGL